jgi:hypothetical protein
LLLLLALEEEGAGAGTPAAAPTGKVRAGEADELGFR